MDGHRGLGVIREEDPPVEALPPSRGRRPLPLGRLLLGEEPPPEGRSLPPRERPETFYKHALEGVEESKEKAVLIRVEDSPDMKKRLLG